MTMALSRLDDDEKMTLSSNESHAGRRGGAQSYNVVNEPGLYALVLGSRKPEARAFKRWVTHEVIPSLRRTGTYSTSAASESLLRAQAMFRNAQTRQAALLLKMAADDRLSPEATELLKVEAAQICTGKPIPHRPTLDNSRYYTATDIAEEAGCSAMRVGLIANEHCLKTEEFGRTVLDKKRHSDGQVATFLYNEAGRVRVLALLGDAGYIQASDDMAY